PSTTSAGEHPLHTPADPAARRIAPQSVRVAPHSVPLGVAQPTLLTSRVAAAGSAREAVSCMSDSVDVAEKATPTQQRDRRVRFIDLLKAMPAMAPDT